MTLLSIRRRLFYHGNRRESAPASWVIRLGCTSARMNVFCANTSAHCYCMCASFSDECLCWFMSIESRHACVRWKYTYTYTYKHTDTHTVSHLLFVLRALFLARGTYIIRVTLGEIIIKKHLQYFFYLVFLSVFFLLIYIFPSFYCIVSPHIFSLFHHRFVSISSLLVHISLLLTPIICLCFLQPHLDLHFL